MIFPIVTILVNSFLLCNCSGVLRIFDFLAPIVEIFHGNVNEVCYDRLGCFSRDGPFKRVNKVRPISVLPQSPDFINTHFHLYTRVHHHDHQDLHGNAESIKNSDFDGRRETKIIVHGFKEGMYFGEYQKDLLIELKDALLYTSDCNVIITRWSRGALGFYFKAVANTRVVGAEIALLIKTLIETTGTNTEKFHIIGHSLGSQVAAYAGVRIHKLGRITCLDAAGPYFDGMNIRARIDHLDALYVDAIHTDSPSLKNPFGVGTNEEVGHIDFYPNNGNSQPGCRDDRNEAMANEGLIGFIRAVIICDHQRSIQLAIDSLIGKNSSCLPVAYRCPNWDKFTSGQCTSCGRHGEDCAVLDISQTYNHIKKRNNSKFFYITNEEKPYCVFQYLIEIKTIAIMDTNLRFSLSFHGPKVKTIYFTTKEFKLMEKITFVMGSEIDCVHHINEITINWFSFDHSNYIREENAIGIEYIRLTPLNHLNDRIKNKLSKKYFTHNQNIAMIKKSEIAKFKYY